MFPEEMGSESLLTISHMPYSHEVANFRWSYAKFLTKEDVKAGTLTLSYDNFIESFLSKDTNLFYLTDDTGIMWRITKTLVRSRRGMHYIIGGGWNKFCQLRNLKEGSGVKIGAPNNGKNEFLFVTVKV